MFKLLVLYPTYRVEPNNFTQNTIVLFATQYLAQNTIVSSFVTHIVRNNLVPSQSFFCKISFFVVTTSVVFILIDTRWSRKIVSISSSNTL
jgi:hypothetical protein